MRAAASKGRSNGGASDWGAGPERSSATAAPAIGEVLLNGNYEIVGLVGRGGMGEIYQARNRNNGAAVALKFIRTELAEDERIRKLFEHEAGTLKRLRCDGVVRYIDLFRDERGRTFLAMDYVEGPSLADRLQEGALSVDQTRKLGCRLAGALAEVHAIGVLHRDLSPDNILLPGDDLDQATMIDFGIAKQTGAATTVVGGDFAGKFAYASPEQVEGRGTDEAGRPKLDARSDIYSLGLVLAAAATGRPINMGRTWAEVVEARRRRPDVSAVPAQLRDAIARMLHPQPSRRPSSMRDVRDLLSRKEDAWSTVALGAVAVAILAAAAGAAYWVLTEPTLEPLVRLPEKPTTTPTEPATGAADPAARPADPAEARPTPVVPDMAAVNARLDDVLDGASCALVKADLVAPGEVSLNGFVAEREVRARLAEAVRTVPGVGRVGTDSIAIQPWPFCEVLRIAGTATVQHEPPRGLGLALNRPDGLYRDGDYLVLDARPPENGSGYLYLDFFDHEGTVVHMVPNALAPDNRYAGGEAIQVGVEQENRRPGVRDYQVSEPYGPGMIFGVVVPTPLYDSPRPEVEQASAYLAVLERGLAEADATGPVVSAIRFIKISR